VSGRDPEASPLPRSEAPEALVHADRRSLLVDDCSLTGGKAVPCEELAVVAAAQEARLLALAPPCDLHAGALRLRAGLLLGLLAEREPDLVEPTRIEAGEHVRLVLPLVDRAREQTPAAVLDDARVVTGRKPSRPGAAGELQELREAKAAVTA